MRVAPPGVTPKEENLLEDTLGIGVIPGATKVLVTGMKEGISRKIIPCLYPGGFKVGDEHALVGIGGTDNRDTKPTNAICVNVSTSTTDHRMLLISIQSEHCFNNTGISLLPRFVNSLDLPHLRAPEGTKDVGYLQVVRLVGPIDVFVIDD
jgi:hypothetical protein